MPQKISTRCCIVGGGPAGLMLGYLLARAGIDVIVLEKHADFLRDFRGDTVHPSTLQLMHELGLLEKFLERPHDTARTLTATVGETQLKIADFKWVPTRCKFIVMMPQWDFLDFLRDEAERYPNFRLVLNAEGIGLKEGKERVEGVLASVQGGTMEIDADLVIAADGRRSEIRKAAGLVLLDLGAPIDVLWMRIATAPDDPQESGGRIGNGYFLAMIHRGEYWQCAYVIPKGGIERIRQEGLDAFRRALVNAAPILKDRIALLSNWEDIKLLSVSVNRLERWWKPGLLCIGDAAHAMSPIGGVGINLAIQDAVAAANLLAPPLSAKNLDPDSITPFLSRVEKRRLLPTRMTQAAQVAVQNRILLPALAGSGERQPSLPLFLRLMNKLPVLCALPAYAIGVGIRPEHIRH